MIGLAWLILIARLGLSKAFPRTQIAIARAQARVKRAKSDPGVKP